MPKKPKKNPDERFVKRTDEDIKKTRQDQINKNTTASERKCEKTFISYIQHNVAESDDIEYWNWPTKKLNDVLSKFWFEIRNQDGERYRVSMLKHYRYAIKWCLQQKGHETDLIKSACYVPSQRAFKDTCSEHKKLGLGYVENYKEITPQGTYPNTFNATFSIFGGKLANNVNKAESVNHNVTSFSSAITSNQMIF